MSKERRRQKAKPEDKDMSAECVESKELSPLRKRYQHDQFCKDQLRDLDKARKILRLIFNPDVIELLDLDNMELVSESFLDEELKKLYADVLYRIPVRNRDEKIVVFVLIELNTESDRWTVFQLAKYTIRIWDEEFRKADQEKRLDTFRLPMVIPVIFHHGEQRFTAPTELIELVHTLKGLEPYTLNMQSLLFDVVTFDEKHLPEDLEIGVLIMILQAVFREDVADRLLGIYRKLRPKIHESRNRRLWEDCLHYALTSAKNFKRQECNDVIQEIHNMGSPITYRTVADDFFDDGFAVGIAQGETRGEANAILLVLKTNHGRVPKSTRDAVRAITDPKMLKKLTILAAKCKTLEEFNKALK